MLSFCFLGEIQREFLVTYDTDKVAATKRPYAFIDIGWYHYALFREFRRVLIPTGYKFIHHSTVLIINALYIPI